MAIQRPMVLGDEPMTPVLDNEVTPPARKSFFGRETQPVTTPVTETRTYDPDLAPVDTDGDGVADTGVLAGGAPIYAARTSDRSGGAGKQIAMVAIPVAVVAVAAGLFLTSNKGKAPISDQPIAAARSPIQPMSSAPPQSAMATTNAPATTETAATSPPATRVSTPAPTRAATSPARHTAAARTRTAARSADTSASDASTVAPVRPTAPVAPVASPPIDTPPPVLTIPEKTVPPATTVPPQTTPQ